MKTALTYLAGFAALILLMSVDSLPTPALLVMAVFGLIALRVDYVMERRRTSLTPLGDRIAQHYSEDLRATIRKIDEGR